MTRKQVKLKDIRIDGGTQIRADLDIDVVNDYADAFASGAKFPPITVYFDGKHHWMGDGFHRYHAATKAGIKELECEVKNGTVRDCILFACGANQGHGLKRTNFDKQCAVKKILNDAEWGIEAPDGKGFADTKVAEVCGVSHVLVASIRKALEKSSSVHNGQSEKRRVGRDGIARRPHKRPQKRVAQKIPPIDDEPQQFDPDAPYEVPDQTPEPTVSKADDNRYGRLLTTMRNQFVAWRNDCPAPLWPAFLVQVEEAIEEYRS